MSGRPLSRRALLEREQELAVLGRAANDAMAGEGSIILIEGEAGIGKSSLVDSIRSVLPAQGRLLVGYCDDLATPRVLGPLRDLRHGLGGMLADALEAGERGRVAEALRAEIDWAGHATVLVIEDVHWADEATLDVLRVLVRQVDQLPVVLALTFRDELAADHPLRHLLGLVSRASRVHRLRLGRLSLDAVRRLGAQTAFDPDLVYAMTSGNPFLVAEVIAAGDVSHVPPSIAEAVGARLSTLDDDARDAVERLAVVPSAAERWLVEAVVPGGLAALALAERQGVLSVSPTRVAFRHELTRRAVADALPVSRRIACNHAVLVALQARHAVHGVDLSRLLHHAAEVVDEPTIIHYGPLAQLEAATAGSHREAVAHGRLVLGQRSAFSPAVLVEILQRHAVECYASDLAEEAMAAQRDAVELRRGLGDARALGLSLRWLSRIAWWAGHRHIADASATESIDVLTEAGDDAALGWALSNQAQLDALAGRWAQAICVGGRAVSIGRHLGDPGLLSHALNTVGFASWHEDPADGSAMLEESLRVALEAGELEHASRAYVNLSWRLIGDLRLDDATERLTAGTRLAEGAEMLNFLRHLRVAQATVESARARWEDAELSAGWGMDGPPMTRGPALVVTGLLRARRGVPGAEPMLAEAMTIANGLAETQRIAPAAAACIEAAWLRGEATAVAAEVAYSYDAIYRDGHGADVAMLAYWLRVAGHDVPVPTTTHPYAWLARGEWRRAAQAWEDAGCPYEQALALSQSPVAADVLAALSILDGIGTAPLARIVRARLRDLGVARIPRGPAPSTRDNPARLTDRQVEVLRLLAAGRTNAEIAAALVLSVRTVDTHVAAILAKLEAPDRRDAARLAADLGLLGPG
ncbi:MAG TPA: AAA family ATPase [Micromonosporaceae bacterium]|jgi:DNA-binding CsgD family transcriptional regulator